ncbi:uncharacterized protein PFL1_02989 [Pseudozyma flocculosa PF-1]|uniref:Ubiquinone biosynthesis protein n=2 Tax=Pseudozyma flocculosa TaxID=84751 RepID=A0A5C3EZP0_9BASI|nr:uncharacterized protein PFL1_02989 [Pseudozyma flocculosa PF-1]EPQ29234.1 hypothetical protein PFL1_02989 [Pseudozyma flocculosa PF-1]SPO37734.1 uncharacterized protein PSFLO_03210 [Pseudozyma flocculosa]
MTTTAATTLTAQLLQRSLPHIPSYGFTQRCVAASNPDVAAHTISSLFPGPDTASTSAPRRLFHAYDEHALHSVLPSLDEGAGREVRMSPPSEQEERKRYDDVVEKLVERLRRSWDVRGALVDGLANEARHPITHLLPLGRWSFDTIPTPLPLLQRSQAITARILTHPSLRYAESDTTQWYATRARLAFAFVVAELHVASQRAECEASQDLLRRVAHARDTSVLSDVLRLRGDANEWIRWGGRGWVGTLRSWGL